jgi:hypothetical protein
LPKDGDLVHHSKHFASERQSEATITVLDQDLCELSYSMETKNWPYFCSSTFQLKPHECPTSNKEKEGTSFLPLFDETDTLVGFTIQGNGCSNGYKNMPSLNVRVGFFATWMKSALCDLSQFPPDYCQNNDSDVSSVVE